MMKSRITSLWKGVQLLLLLTCSSSESSVWAEASRVSGFGTRTWRYLVKSCTIAKAQHQIQTPLVMQIAATDDRIGWTGAATLPLGFPLAHLEEKKPQPGNRRVVLQELKEVWVNPLRPGNSAWGVTCTPVPHGSVLSGKTCKLVFGAGTNNLSQICKNLWGNICNLKREKNVHFTCKSNGRITTSQRWFTDMASAERLKKNTLLPVIYM